MNPVLGVAGSVLFTVYLFVSVFFFGIAALLAGIVSREHSYAVAVSWARAVLYLLKKLCGLDYSVTGTEHLTRQNCIVLVKHSSSWETIAQFVMFPRQTWVLKRELLWAPVLGWVIRIYRPIAIDRKAGRTAVEQVVTQGRERLEDGDWVIIFPEGTRVAPGEVGRYGQSGALLAIDSGRPIIPVAHDAGVYWRRRSWRKRPGTIRVVIGAPIESAGRSPRELTNEVKEWIESTVASLSDI
ncbi:MAG: lysophospholipid acyltransferase family protein [Candidatus Rariloculaceae bacterium]